MPYCSHCGDYVQPAQAFCRQCGAAQPVEPGAAIPPMPPASPGVMAGINPRTASILCYVPGMGWIFAIVVLASLRFRSIPTVRFHAFQGLYLFVAWLMNEQVLKWAFGPISFLHLHDLVRLALLGMSIFMMVKAAHDEAYSLPLFGELAHRSMSEN
jgi:uncharacterized membrane protein